MSKAFWRDKDGFTSSDFEKIILGAMFVLGCVVTYAKYWSKDTLDPNVVYLTTGIGGLFVVRKATSYFKPKAYYEGYSENESMSSAEYDQIEELALTSAQKSK